MSDQDHYAVLGVAHDADRVVVKAAYEALWKKDHSGPRKAELDEAVAVLGDPARRAAYDAGRQVDPSREEIKRSVRSLSVKRWGGLAVKVIAALGAFSIGQQLISGFRGEPEQVIVEAGGKPVEAGAPVADAAGEIDARRPTPQPAVILDTVDTAARLAARELKTKGLAGVRKTSEECYAKAAAVKTWTQLDFCAAFDMAAQAASERVEGEFKVKEVPYASLMVSDRLEQAGVTGGTIGGTGKEKTAVTQRLETIRRSIQPTLRKAMIENRERGQRRMLEEEGGGASAPVTVDPGS